MSDTVQILCEGPKCNGVIGADELENAAYGSLSTMSRSRLSSEDVYAKVTRQLQSNCALTRHKQVSGTRGFVWECDVCGYRRRYGGGLSSNPVQQKPQKRNSKSVVNTDSGKSNLHTSSASTLQV